MAADELQQLVTQGAIARRKISFVPAKKPTNPAPPAGVDILWLTPRPEVFTQSLLGFPTLAGASAALAGR